VSGSLSQSEVFTRKMNRDLARAAGPDQSGVTDHYFVALQALGPGDHFMRSLLRGEAGVARDVLHDAPGFLSPCCRQKPSNQTRSQPLQISKELCERQ